MNLHQTSHGASEHLNTTFHIEKTGSLIAIKIFLVNVQIFYFKGHTQKKCQRKNNKGPKLDLNLRRF